MKEKIKYLECLKSNCEQLIDNLKLYYTELSRHQKSKCSNFYQKNKEKFNKCQGEILNDKFLIKLMKILDTCATKKCQEDQEEFFNNLMFILISLFKKKMNSLKDNLKSVSLVIEYLAQNKNKSNIKSSKAFNTFIEKQDLSKKIISQANKHFEEFKYDNQSLDLKISNLKNDLDLLENIIQNKFVKNNKLGEVSSKNVTKNKIINTLKKKQTQSNPKTKKEIKELIKKINEDFEDKITKKYLLKKPSTKKTKQSGGNNRTDIKNQILNTYELLKDSSEFINKTGFKKINLLSQDISKTDIKTELFNNNNYRNEDQNYLSNYLGNQKSFIKRLFNKDNYYKDRTKINNFYDSHLKLKENPILNSNLITVKNKTKITVKEEQDLYLYNSYNKFNEINVNFKFGTIDNDMISNFLSTNLDSNIFNFVDDIDHLKKIQKEYYINQIIINKFIKNIDFLKVDFNDSIFNLNSNLPKITDVVLVNDFKHLDIFSKDGIDTFINAKYKNDFANKYFNATTQDSELYNNISNDEYMQNHFKNKVFSINTNQLYQRDPEFSTPDYLSSSLSGSTFKIIKNMLQSPQPNNIFRIIANLYVQDLNILRKVFINGESNRIKLLNRDIEINQRQFLHLILNSFKKEYTQTSNFTNNFSNMSGGNLDNVQLNLNLLYNNLGSVAFKKLLNQKPLHNSIINQILNDDTLYFDYTVFDDKSELMKNILKDKLQADNIKNISPQILLVILKEYLINTNHHLNKSVKQLDLSHRKKICEIITLIKDKYDGGNLNDIDKKYLKKLIESIKNIELKDFQSLIGPSSICYQKIEELLNLSDSITSLDQVTTTTTTTTIQDQVFQQMLQQSALTMQQQQLGVMGVGQQPVKTVALPGQLTAVQKGLFNNFLIKILKLEPSNPEYKTLRQLLTEIITQTNEITKINSLDEFEQNLYILDNYFSKMKEFQTIFDPPGKIKLEEPKELSSIKTSSEEIKRKSVPDSSTLDTVRSAIARNQSDALTNLILNVKFKKQIETDKFLSGIKTTAFNGLYQKNATTSQLDIINTNQPSTYGSLFWKSGSLTPDLLKSLNYLTNKDKIFDETQLLNDLLRLDIPDRLLAFERFYELINTPTESEYFRKKFYGYKSPELFPLIPTFTKHFSAARNKSSTFDTYISSVINEISNKRGIEIPETTAPYPYTIEQFLNQQLLRGMINTIDKTGLYQKDVSGGNFYTKKV